MRCAPVASLLGSLPVARLLVHLAVPGTAITLLRMIMGLPLPNTPRACVVGVGYWALGKEQTYGNIILNLE